ncbi:MAG: hypothetical protein ACYCYF_06475, partial [Anaerolineae bacterium]
MRDSSRRIPLGWVIGLLVVILVAALPAVWASPLAQPLRQTIPDPDPTPTPRIVECTLLAPCDSTTIALPLKNEGTLPMEGCVVRLEGVAGIEYLVNQQVLASPYTIAVPRLLPGDSANLAFDIRLMCEDPAVVPCMSYVMDVYLECGTQVTMIEQLCIESPCP